MNAPSSTKESDARQNFRYLLLPPILFAVGFGVAKLASTFVGQDLQKWLDPINWGGILALIGLVQSLPRTDAAFAGFGPSPPNNRRLAAVSAVSLAVCFTALFEFLLYWNRSLLAESPGPWFVPLIAILAPIAVVVGSWRRYRKDCRRLADG